MRRSGSFARWLVPGMALAALTSGCESLPTPTGEVGRDSSLLGVEVRFPFRLSRDPTLVRAWLVRGPIHRGMEELPELIPATLVRESRAYWLDPEPGTYSLVAVAFDYAPPRHTDPATGMTLVAASGETAGQVVVLPLETIHRTRTTVGPGLVRFMGALDVERGERISADTGLEDPLQRRLADQLRPGATAQAGIAARLSTTWTLDRQATAFHDEAPDLDDFRLAARADFGDSPWAEVIPGPRQRGERSRARLERLERREELETAAVPRPSAAPVPRPSAAPGAAVAAPEPTPPAAEPPRPGPVEDAPEEREADEPEPPAIAALAPPAGHPLAHVEIGMSNEDVHALVGDPDARDSSLTLRAWIPFYTGPDAQRITWIYTGKGRVVFSVDDGLLEVIDVVYEGAAAP